MAFKKGDALKQRVVVVQGLVKDVQYDADTGKFKYLLAWEEGDETPERWFDEDEVDPA